MEKLLIGLLLLTASNTFAASDINFNKLAYWYNKKLWSVTFTVATPDSVYTRKIYDTDNFSFNIENIKNRIIMPVCLEESKKGKKFNRNKMNDCLKFNSYSFERKYKYTFCDFGFQNNDGTAKRPEKCQSNAAWYLKEQTDGKEKSFFAYY